jgi:radical SAM protein with 4Fe4S-binding SPASM domain
MKIISATFADLEHSDLGTKSRLTAELRGVPVLRRTLERVTIARAVARHFVLCPQPHLQRLRDVVAGLPVELVAVDGEPDPWRTLTRVARKWSLDGWRGGIGGTTYFDEFCFPGILSRVASMTSADAVFAYPAAAPLISPTLIASMVDRRAMIDDQARMAFSQAVPGLAGLLVDAGLVEELAQTKTPPGSLFSYKPDSPRKDLIFHSACIELPAAIRFATGRLVADTDRSLERINALLRHVRDPSDKQIGDWLIEDDDNRTEAFPREVEIELTTDSPYPRSLTRPAPARSRGPLDESRLARLAQELSVRDDTLVVLGGFGDPLRHPRLGAVLSARTSAGRPYGLAVRTFATDLDQSRIELLVRYGVDVCCVALDAWTAQLYGQLHVAEADAAGLETVLGRLNRLAEVRQEHRSIAPIVVPEFCKSQENIHEMDDFFDGWLRRTGTASIVGYSHRSGACPDRAVVDMCPPTRTACRRIRTRCLILANGDVTACDQDLHGAHSLGSIYKQSLGEIWESPAYRSLRELHAARRWAAQPLCAGCTEWHRP